MKKSLMLVLVLLCMASLVAGMAYTSATLDTESHITLSAAEDGMLAFVARDDVKDPDGIFKIEDNVVTMNLSAGADEQYGIQKNASYDWQQYFLVKNNTAEPTQIHVINSEQLNALSESNVNFSLYAEIYEGEDRIGDRIYLISNNVSDNGDESYLKLNGMQSARVSISISALEGFNNDNIEKLDVPVVFRAGDWSEGQESTY